MAVLNKHKSGHPIGAVYIGRGSKWGNPFVIGTMTRDEVCEAYRRYLKSKLLAGTITDFDLLYLHDKDLVCFCKPAKCHGDVLERAALWAFKGGDLNDLDF
jgi:hypothetical protein